jgi:hypothetical protein
MLTYADVAGKGVREAKEALKKAEIGKKAESFAAGPKFSCFASTKVQILTPSRQRERRNGSRSSIRCLTRCLRLSKTQVVC